MALQFALLVPLAYLWGSIPWGLVVARLVKGIDPRHYGSGKTGTTNVIRTVGVKAGLAVLLLDLAKGALAVLMARNVGASPWLATAVGLAVLAGHNWSVFLRFQGGRGTAPGAGAMAVLSPFSTVAALLIGGPAILLTRYMSLGSIVGAAVAMASSLALSLTGLQGWPATAYVLAGGTVILLSHRENISRLLQGTERRLGQPAQPLPRGSRPRREKG